LAASLPQRGFELQFSFRSLLPYMRTKRGTPETLRWPASEVYGVSRSSKGLQTASAKSMMRQRSQNQLSRAVTGAGRDWTDKSAGKEIFAKATAGLPMKKQLTIRIDADVLAWLKAHGRGYQTRISRILRFVMESQPASAEPLTLALPPFIDRL